MKFNSRTKGSKVALLLVAFAIVSLILWNTNLFFKKFKEEERLKMEIWAEAQYLFSQTPLDEDPGDLPLKVFQNNRSTPMVLVSRDGNYKANNIPLDKVHDSAYIHKLIQIFKAQNTPIVTRHNNEVLTTLYYGNSEVINKLKYYPLALLLIIFLFGVVIYFFFKTNKAAEQNRLWAGMAKETAHQIGTPLSSLLGWNQLLKEENINPEIPMEIEKDIQRLETITDRFSKIGSLPTLKEHDIVEETKKAFEYLQKRSSKLIQFNFNSQTEKEKVLLNIALYNWTVENLVKNGIDAMKGKGSISVDIVPETHQVSILISDTGSGIAKSDFRSIFEPGVTSKKRGWGLGLSLVKRIIEEYHKGKVRVYSSSKAGTVIQIILKTIP